MEYQDGIQPFSVNLVRYTVRTRQLWNRKTPLKQYIIDFSQTAVGAVLSQEQNGVERFLGVKGRKCRPYESNYHSSKGELLALCYALTINTTIFLDCPSSAWLQILLQCCIGAR